MQFSELGLCQEVLNGVLDMGFEKATEIQEKAIPVLLKGTDILATSATGSGKTAAFAMPILHKLFNNKKKAIQALILAPTRELAQQIDEQLWVLGYHTGLSSATVYGGSDWAVQEKALKNGVNIVVATPGRLLDQMKITTYDFSNLEFLVLDEADRMLDMGFIPDVRSIINRMPKERQTLLFSATMTPKIESLAKEFTKGKYERIKIGMPAPAKGINQVCYNVDDHEKIKLLLHLYESQKWHSAIVFASTKRGVDQLARALNQKGAQVESMHGDKDQKDREATLERFKSGKVKVIIATDVMARGIDVDNISHIVNYDVPHDADDYIHRIGRTARAESTGDAITFVSPKDMRKMKDIFKVVESYIPILNVPNEVSGAGKSGGQDTADSSEEKQSRSRGRGRGQQRTQKPKADKPARADDKKQDKKGQSGQARKKAGGRKNQQKQSRDDRSGKKGSQKQSGGRRQQEKKPATQRQKHIQNQEKLIEQVQQSTIPEPDKKPEKGGVWKKIKGLFG